MRNVLASLALLAALGFVAWLVLHETPVEVRPAEGPGTTSPTVPRPAPVATTAATTGLAGEARPSPTTRPGKKPDPPRGVGSARITFSTSDASDPGPAVRLDVEPLGASLVHYPLAVHQDDGSWVYAALPAGRYRVRAVVPGFQTKEADAKVEPDAETAIALQLEKGGEIAFRAVLYSGDAPEWIRLRLLDAKGASVAASLQLAGGPARIDPRVTSDLPAEGRVMGLKPGAYRLRATAPSGEDDEQAVTLRAGEVASVELKIRK